MALILQRFLAASLLNKARLISTDSYVSLYVLITPKIIRQGFPVRESQQTVATNHLDDQAAFGLLWLFLNITFATLDARIPVLKIA